MPTIAFEDTLPYEPLDLYRFIMDVERYPAIFDDIKALRVILREDDRLEAQVRVEKMGLSVNYNCQVRGEPQRTTEDGKAAPRISIEQTHGDFKNMRAQWDLAAHPEGGTKVTYRMAFDFGGMGFKNAAASAMAESEAHLMKDRLRAYLVRTLTPTAP